MKTPYRRQLENCMLLISRRQTSDSARIAPLKPIF
jgi:hypothetical protein